MAETKRRTAPKGARRLTLRFETRDAFEEQYAQNLAKGGAFIPTEEAIALRDVIEVELDLVFTGARLLLAAEVVHCVTPDIAPAGVPAGVAVQFLDDAKGLRTQFGALLDGESGSAPPDDPPTCEIDAEVGAPPDLSDPGGGVEFSEADLSASAEAGQAPDDDDFDASLFDHDALDLTGGGEGGVEEDLSTLIGGAEAVGDPILGGTPLPPENDRTFTERADRESVRVPVEVRSATGVALRGRTRNVSESGVLISIDGEELAVGRDVQVALIHPRTGATTVVPGKVNRRIEGSGAIVAAAIQLLPEGEAREELRDFVEDVHEIERTYRARGIRGHLQELGSVSLIQMFSALAPRGTLTVCSGVEEGTIAFEGSQLALAEVGSVEGVKALARILSWRDGHFEFRAHMDAVTSERPRTSLEKSVEAALELIEEEGRVEGPMLSPDQRFAVNHAKLSKLETPLNKSEEAVLELAAADFTLRRILDVIPDNDAQVRAAILSLARRGLLTTVPSIGA